MKGKMKFITAWLFYASTMMLISSVRNYIGYGAEARRDTDDAILHISENVNPLKDFTKPQISESEKSRVGRHFRSHHNSLDSVSDFAYGRHGDQNTTHTSKDHSHSHKSEDSHVLPHDDDEGK